MILIFVFVLHGQDNRNGVNHQQQRQRQRENEINRRYTIDYTTQTIIHKIHILDKTRKK